jgi:outer membrane protein assembly factor BamB
MDLRRQSAFCHQCQDVIDIIERFSAFVPFDNRGELVTEVVFRRVDPSRSDFEIFCATDERGWFYISMCDEGFLHAYDENGVLRWARTDLDNPGQLQVFKGQLYITMWNDSVDTTQVELYDRDTGVFQRLCGLPNSRLFDSFKGHILTMGILSTGEFVFSDWNGRIFIVPSENSNAKNITFFDTSHFKSQSSVISSIYIHSDDTIWLPRVFGNSRINIYTKTGQHLRSLPVEEVKWCSPSQIAISVIGEIFVSDHNRGLIVYNADFTFNRHVNLNNPPVINIQCIAVSKFGKVFIGGPLNAGIFKPVM